MLLEDGLTSDPNNGETPRRRISFRRKCNISATIGGLMAAALAPVDISSWAGDDSLHLRPQPHALIVIAICLLIAPAIGRFVVTHTVREQAQMWLATEEKVIERVVDEKLKARRNELINVMTDLVHELIHDIEPRQQHLIQQAVRNALRPQIAEMKKGVASGMNAAARAGLIAGAQQNTQPRQSRRRSGASLKDVSVPTLGTVRHFRQASNDN